MPKQPWESSSSLHGMLNDFKGVLSTLDPESGSSLLDLRDPSKPARRAASSPLCTSQAPTSSASAHASVTPIVALSTESSGFATESRDSLADPVVPPRKSSLRTPARSRSGSGPHQQAMGLGGVPPRMLKHGPSPLRQKGYGNQMQSSYRDTSRLRVHHSTASTSEPSLIPANDARACMFCTSSLIFFFFADVWVATMLTVGSNELTVNDLALPRFASNPSFSHKDKEEVQDPEERGKELAVRCYQEDETFLAKDKIAEWLGGQYVQVASSGHALTLV